MSSKFVWTFIPLKSVFAKTNISIFENFEIRPPSYDTKMYLFSDTSLILTTFWKLWSKVSYIFFIFLYISATSITHISKWQKWIYWCLQTSSLIVYLFGNLILNPFMIQRCINFGFCMQGGLKNGCLFYIISYF